MDFRTVRLEEVASTTRSSVTPQEGVKYWHYSLPSFDTGRKPAKEDGGEILSSKLLVRKGDILCNKLNMRFRRIWRIDEELPNSICSTEFIPLQAKRINRDYLYYVLISDDFTNTMTSMRFGTSGSHQRVKPEQLLSYEFKIPDESKQESIANILVTIDQKIELNNQINDYLSDLVSLEFFNRFGADTPTVELGEVLTISTKSLKPQEYGDDIWEHYSIPAYDEAHRPVFEPASNIKSNKYAIDRDCILVSRLNPSTKRIWMPACIGERPVCSTEFIVYRPKEPKHRSFYYAAIDTGEFTDFLLAHATGSTGSRQRSQPKSTLAYPLPAPGSAAIDRFCDFADPIYKQIETNELESKRLEDLRCALLPRLMSGEIDVSRIDLM